MIEIFVIWQICKKIGVMMKQKGRKPFWFQAMLVCFWFGGEFFGAFLGAMITGDAGLPMYLCALAGAAIGSVTAYLIANTAAPGVPEFDRPTGGFPVLQPKPADASPPQQV